MKFRGYNFYRGLKFGLPIGVFLWVMVFFCFNAFTATIFVTTAGDDGTGDGSSGNPYATFTFAYSVANNNDTVSVGEGTYTVNDNFDLNGVTGITFKETSGDVFIDGSATYHFRIFADSIMIDGFEFLTGNSNIHNIWSDGADNAIIKNCILLDSMVIGNSDGWLIENNTITNANSGTGTAGVWLIDGSDNNLIRGNTINNSSYWGIEIGGAGGKTTVNNDNNIVEDNLIINASKHGIKVFKSKNNIVRRNDVSGSTGFGLHNDQCSNTYLGTDGNNRWYNNKVYKNGIGQTTNGAGINVEGSDLTYVYNNTFSENGTNGIVIQDDADGVVNTNVYVANNIVHDNGDDGVGMFVYQVLVEDIANLASFNNNDLYDNALSDIFYDEDNATGYTKAELNALAVASGNLDDDPLLNDNFDIPTNSPAKDAGVTITSITDDFRRLGRPQGSAYDIGAMEFGDLISFNGLTLSGVDIN